MQCEKKSRFHLLPNCSVGLFVIALLVGACGNKFQILKRHYRPGIYIHAISNVKSKQSTSFLAKQKSAKLYSQAHNSSATQFVDLQKNSPEIKPIPNLVPQTRVERSRARILEKLKTYSTVLKDDEPVDYAKKAKQARLKSRIYFASATLLLFSIVTNIWGVVVLLLFLIIPYLYVLSIVNRVRRKRYNSYVKEPPPPKAIDPHRNEGRQKKLFNIFLILDLIFIGTLFLNPVFVILLLPCIVLTIILNEKLHAHKKERYQQKKLSPDEMDVQARDRKEVRIALRSSLLSFLFWLVFVFSFAFIEIVSDAAILLVAITALILSLVFIVKGKRYASGVLRRHKGESYFPYQRSAKFFVFIFYLMLLMMLVFIALLPYLTFAGA